MALSQTDLDVRLQQLGCCIGKEAKKLQQYYAWGSECKEEQENKVLLLEAYAEILKCYIVQSSTSTDWEYYAVYTIADGISIGDVFEVFAGGNLILSYTAASTNVCTVFTAIASAITALEGDYSGRATCGEIFTRIAITVPCDETPVYVKITRTDGTEVYVNMQVSIEGKCSSGDDDNCITEDQLNVILENISKLCKICFQPEGFAYYTQ